MTAATIGNWSFTFGGSPQVALEEVLDVSGVGETNTLQDVTNFDSTPGQKEFIGGLAEGDEVTIECNMIAGAPNQAALIAQCKAKTNGSATLTYTASPEQVFAFDFAPISWQNAGSLNEQNKMSFTIKISGGVTVT